MIFFLPDLSRLSHTESIRGVNRIRYTVDKIIGDDKIHRFKINGKPNGWYVLFVGKYSNGVYGDWKTGNKFYW